MSKSEFIEWALEEIIVPINDNVDIIESWFVGSKDCRCPITKQINDAVYKLIHRYDFVIFDCEFKRIQRKACRRDSAGSCNK